MSEWKFIKVEDIVSKDKYSCVGGPFGSNLVSQDYVNNSGVPVARGNNFSGSRYFYDKDFVFVSEEKAKTLIQNSTYRGDLVFTQRGTIGQVALIPYDSKYSKYILSQNLMKLSVDQTKADARFLCYYFLSPKSQKIISQNSIGSTIPGFNLTQLRNFPVFLPPLEEQKQIADVLSCLDDKIDNLRRQNETLEAIAQTLFKHWFIDFEFPNADGKPYKSSGGGMCRSSIGDVPEGWRFSRIGDEVETVGGGTPSTTELSYWKNGDIAWYSPTDLTKAKTLFSIDSEKKITSLGLQKSSARLFPKYSLLLTSRATIGEVTINTKDACTNQGFITIIPNERFSVYFLYGWLLTKIGEIKQLASGSTFPEISKTIFRGLDFLIPVNDVLENYEKLIKPIYKKIETNIFQIQTLTKTRDALLPKLMSGQLRVKE